MMSSLRYFPLRYIVGRMPFKIKPALYHVWNSMRDRCNNPNFRQYGDYGGRGISICDRWDSFATFIEDMGPRPKGYLIDRIDNDGNYTPENCRWVDRKTSQRNQRVTRWVEVEGKRHKAADLADIAGIKTDSIVDRAKQGLTYDEVVDPRKRLKGPPKKTHCPQGHSYEGTRLTKAGYPICRICHRDRERKRLAMKEK